jgi:hypothetical protein
MDGWSQTNQWTYDAQLATEPDMDYPTYHAQKVTFDQSSTCSPLTIAIGPGHGGYEASGLFHLGYTTWARVLGVAPLEQITGEFSNYRTTAFGHEVRWGSWYSDDGGRLTLPGSPSRFQIIPAGTAWSDDFVVKIGY